MTATGRAPGPLLGSGRTADVYEVDAAWVLRRDREGRGDAVAEGALLSHLRSHGYPVPAVRHSASGTDLVMERLTGPTMLQALAAGALAAGEAGAVLAGLLRALHAVPAPGGGAGVSVLHLDLHPDNVILTADGPRVIDWSDAGQGPPALDWGCSADPLAGAAHALLAGLLADPSDLTEDGLVRALERRAVNPTMSAGEVGLLGAAGELIRALAAR